MFYIPASLLSLTLLTACPYEELDGPTSEFIKEYDQEVEKGHKAVVVVNDTPDTINIYDTVVLPRLQYLIFTPNIAFSSRDILQNYDIRLCLGDSLVYKMPLSAKGDDACRYNLLGFSIKTLNKYSSFKLARDTIYDYHCSYTFDELSEHDFRIKLSEHSLSNNK